MRYQKGGFDKLDKDATQIIREYMKDIFIKLDPLTDGLLSNIAYALNNYNSTMELFRALKEKGILEKELTPIIRNMFQKQVDKSDAIKYFLKENKQDLIKIIKTASDDDFIINEMKGFILKAVSTQPNMKGGRSKKNKNGGAKSDPLPPVTFDDKFFDKMLIITDIILYELNKHISIVEIINATASYPKIKSMLLDDKIKSAIVKFMITKINPMIHIYKHVILHINRLFVYNDKKMTYFALLEKHPKLMMWALEKYQETKNIQEGGGIVEEWIRKIDAVGIAVSNPTAIIGLMSIYKDIDNAMKNIQK